MDRSSFQTLATSAVFLASVPGVASASLVYGFDNATLQATQTLSHTAASGLSISSNWGSTCYFQGNPGFACGPFGDGTMSFSITADAGYGLDITRLSFDERNFGAFGPTAFSVFTSADGFASAILTDTLGSEAPWYTSHSVGLALTNWRDPLQVRIVATGRPGLPASGWLLDNVRLDGSAQPAGAVSAPDTLALAVLGLAALGATRRR
jgi:hypothetical protein